MSGPYPSPHCEVCGQYDYVCDDCGLCVECDECGEDDE